MKQSQRFAQIEEAARNEIESQLMQFDRQWHAELLEERALGLQELEADARIVFMLEMAKIDMEYRRQHGTLQPVETYLSQFQDLQQYDTVISQLICTEYRVRRQFGDSLDFDQFAARFPDQVQLLRELSAEDESLAAAHPADDRQAGSQSADITAQETITLTPNTDFLYGRYRVISQLGRGGMGEVYRALDTVLKRQVAVKILPGDHTNEIDWRIRFEREAQAIAALPHPNIRAIYDFGFDGRTPYAVMELLEGETLREKLVAQPIPWLRARDIAESIALGMAAAHAKGIVHRDLKPSNIFLTSNGHTKILDFGLSSAALAISEETASQEQAAETTSTRFMGTPGYMSPEQLQSHPSSPASDLFAFGCVVYEMIAGHRAHKGSTVNEVIDATLQARVTPLSRVDVDVPVNMQEIVSRCMQHDPTQRYASAKELIEDLRSVDVRAKEVSKKKTLRGAMILAAVVAIVAAIVTFGPQSWEGGVREKAVGQTGSQVMPAGKSLAVVPLTFADGGGTDFQFLSDGISDGLMNQLARNPHLKIVNGRALNAERIKDDLNVRLLLSGRIERVGQKTVIHVDLEDLVEKTRIWGRQYASEEADAFFLHEQIVGDVIDSLGSVLPQSSLRRFYSMNPDAVREYWMGRNVWRNNYGKDLTPAIAHYKKAIEIDEQFSLAWAGLADAYNLMGVYGFLPGDQAKREGQAAAKRALELSDNLLAEAHTAMAFNLACFGWKENPQKWWSLAVYHYERAIELKPSDGTALRWYASLLATLGREEEAIEHALLAQQAQPGAPIMSTSLGWVYFLLGRYDEAIEVLTTAVTEDPNSVPAHIHLALTYAASGRHDDALAEIEALNRLTGGKLTMAGFKCQVLAEAGRIDQARQIHVADLDSFGRAHAYTGLGEYDKAVDALEQAYDEWDWKLGNIGVEASWRPLRNHPRFQALVRRVGVPR